MISNAPHCDVCRRRSIVSYRVEPEEAWKLVVLGRWRNVCPSCFDAEAEKARVRYRFADIEADSWSERPPPRKPSRRRR